jgi:hypothetical protein
VEAERVVIRPGDRVELTKVSDAFALEPLSSKGLALRAAPGA